MISILTRTLLAGLLAGGSFSGLAAKLETTTPVPPEALSFFNDNDWKFSFYNHGEPPAGPAPTGTIEPKAWIQPLQTYRDDLDLEIPQLWCAIDRSVPGGDFDVIRIDSLGTGDFRQADALKLKRAPQDGQDGNDWEFSGILRLKAEGRVVSCLAKGTVNGKLDKTEDGDPDSLSINLEFAAFASALVDCNGRACRVVVVDGNANGRVVDAAVLPRRLHPGRPDGKRTGDPFALDLDGNGFRGRVLSGFLGVPFCLDGHWLELRGDAGAQELTAVPLPAPVRAGTLEFLSAGHFRAEVSGGGHWFTVVDGQPPIPLGPGKYVLNNVTLVGPGKGSCLLSGMADKENMVIEEGAAATVSLPQRIQVRVDADCEVVGPMRLAFLDLALETENGLDLYGPTAADGRPALRQIRIFDAAGKLVHEGKLDKDGDDPSSYLWKVPAGLSGEFTALAVFEPLPLPAEAVPCKFTVPPPQPEMPFMTLSVARVEATAGIDPEQPWEGAFDDHGETCLATARPPQPGEAVTVFLARPLLGHSSLSLSVEGGEAEVQDGDKDSALAGKAVVEVSSDGKTFREVGELTDFQQDFLIRGLAVSAFRIRFTSPWKAPFCLTEVSARRLMTPAEKQQEAEWLKQYDLNGNGQLDPEERARAEKETKAGIEAPAMDD